MRKYLNLKKPEENKSAENCGQIWGDYEGKRWGKVGKWGKMGENIGEMKKKELRKEIYIFEKWKIVIIEKNKYLNWSWFCVT